jgi:hypothetical protein
MIKFASKNNDNERAFRNYGALRRTTRRRMRA